MRKPTEQTERRLDQLRAQYADSALATVNRQASTYYDLPLLKPPVWTWEIPAYFFVGGTAGALAVIGFASRLTGGEETLIREARRLAAVGANLSVPLLIADLGRPDRFLNMLRVFKPQSPMSVGAWLVALFGASATASAVFRGRLADVAAAVSALSGLGMATYTGVLIGATSIPAWRRHVALLPLHFGASALGSAASLLELRGRREGALHYLGLSAAAFETLAAALIEARRDIESKPLRRGATGATMTLAELFAGPIPLVLRLFGRRSKRLRRAAAASTLLGSLITRIAWIEAGRSSARDPRASMSEVIS